MSQTLLFSIGVGVFAITVVASLLYGYFTLDHIYQADAAERPAIDASTPSVAPSLPISSPVVAGSNPASKVPVPQDPHPASPSP